METQKYRYIHSGNTYELIKNNGTSWTGRNVFTGEVRETLKPVVGDEAKQWRKVF